MSESGAGAVLAWHFLREGGLTRDNHVAHVGETLHVDPPIKLCDRGLHASRRLIDALEDAPGPVLCRVRCSGELIEGGDKLVCTDREILAMADVSLQLHEFACDEAERALRSAGVDDERSWRAIKAKRAWLRGEATDADLSAAWSAAWDAADAARAAAADATRAATRAATWAAAWAATWVATANTPWSAARDAAWEAAQSAAWAEQNARLEGLLAPVLGLEPGAAGNGQH